MSAPPSSLPPEKLLKRVEEVLGEPEKGPWPSHVKELRKTQYPLHINGVGLVAKKSPWGLGISPGGGCG
jgi:sulfite reductase alpha subunit